LCLATTLIGGGVCFTSTPAFADSIEDICDKIRDIRYLAQAEGLNQRTLALLERKYCSYYNRGVTPRNSRSEGEIRIFGAKGSEYLGCWNCSANSSDSIFNTQSFFRDLKNFNNVYGDKFSDYAACSAFANNPPILQFTLTSGNAPPSRYLGRLSLNAFQKDSICNSGSEYYWSEGCQDLRKYCGL
ncbi:MAG TPA: hypothetical protein VK203_16695, partial [Nostocaceae cyanobacterium]|nr:hypothetical protein [Nostocaceae cyanobacterium]